MYELTDRIIGAIGIIGMIALLCVNAWEFGRDSGKREAIAAMKCQTNSAYSIIDNRTGKCAEKKGKKG